MSTDLWALVQLITFFLTFLLALLVGMEFPAASKLLSRGRGWAASRLYTADFTGAFLGALLTSTLLIPIIGVSSVCWLNAALNAVGALTLLRQNHRK
ncbi:MAG: hypothetical protein M1608_09065 [Candidatus Omnitrophica bacterium]|nr:hypothetical protein [Candidatus Omnitrophota bacterium]